MNFFKIILILLIFSFYSSLAQADSHDKDKNIIDLDIGETIVFKSSLYHKAKKVLHGTRLVLVAWLN